MKMRRRVLVRFLVPGDESSIHARVAFLAETDEARNAIAFDDEPQLIVRR